MAETDTTDSEELTTQPDVKTGIELDLFWQETSLHERRRYWFHFTVYVILLASTVWPLFTVFNQIEPYVLGLPFNIFWHFLVIVLLAINTYLLYRFDEGKLQEGGE